MGDVLASKGGSPLQNVFIFNAAGDGSKISPYFITVQIIYSGP